jgi:hypothetical protein
MPIMMHNNVAFCSRYTIGGYDGDAGAMTATVEFYEPRMPSWVVVEPMNYTRGYHASAVLGGSIFTFGGVKGEADTILDVVGTPVANFLPCCAGTAYVAWVILPTTIHLNHTYCLVYLSISVILSPDFALFDVW